MADAEALIGPVCEHLAEHGATIDRDGDAGILIWPQARLQAGGGRLTARAEADDRESLYLLKFGIASHVIEFAGEPSPSMAWSGGGLDIVTPPNFRVATVVAVAEPLCPRFRASSRRRRPSCGEPRSSRSEGRTTSSRSFGPKASN
ncbi:DUF2218 domain-containing protein [Methylopila sp. 73B]|uniref:DUF2218 domain-containing protein n=1 Tax=Methylopila sp. 73B TaxID=1120792 RepID=UPI001FD92B9D|nr:DUF2218 domain-containing protein [Methylopila sp. 73B]